MASFSQAWPAAAAQVSAVAVQPEVAAAVELGAAADALVRVRVAPAAVELTQARAGAFLVETER